MRSPTPVNARGVASSLVVVDVAPQAGPQVGRQFGAEAVLEEVAQDGGAHHELVAVQLARGAADAVGERRVVESDDDDAALGGRERVDDRQRAGEVLLAGRERHDAHVDAAARLDLPVQTRGADEALAHRRAAEQVDGGARRRPAAQAGDAIRHDAGVVARPADEAALRDAVDGAARDDRVLQRAEAAEGHDGERRQRHAGGRQRTAREGAPQARPRAPGSHVIAGDRWEAFGGSSCEG